MPKRVPRYQREANPRPDQPPAGRIAADLTRQAPHNSYAGVPLYYEDTPSWRRRTDGFRLAKELCNSISASAWKSFLQHGQHYPRMFGVFHENSV